MPNIKSAEKRLHQSQARRARNRPVRTIARNQVRDALEEINAGGAVDPAVRAAVSALDKAAQKGIIHPNNAARRKSRLMRRMNAT